MGMFSDDEMISGGVALGLIVSGIIHALIFYEQYQVLRMTRKPLESDYKDNGKTNYVGSKWPESNPSLGWTVFNF